MPDTKLKAGAVYTFTRDDGTVEEFLCWSTIARPGHAVSGWVQRFGHAKQIMKEGTDQCNKITMVVKEKPVVKKAPAKKPAAKKTVSKKASVEKASK